MWRNFLLDKEGDKLNTILAATGFNLRKMLQRIKAGAREILTIFFKEVFLLKITGKSKRPKIVGVFHVRLVIYLHFNWSFGISSLYFT
jgi:hypothetical protein